jgi:hypothetical protein
MSWFGWWVGLYYPIMGMPGYALYRLDRKRGRSRKRDQVFGALFMFLVLFPVFGGVVQIIIYCIMKALR